MDVLIWLALLGFWVESIAVLCYIAMCYLRRLRLTSSKLYHKFFTASTGVFGKFILLSLKLID
jgi:hypothetical protein